MTPEMRHRRQPCPPQTQRFFAVIASEDSTKSSSGSTDAALGL